MKTIKLTNADAYAMVDATPEEAARCYDKTAKIHFGAFANLNFYE